MEASSSSTSVAADKDHTDDIMDRAAPPRIAGLRETTHAGILTVLQCCSSTGQFVAASRFLLRKSKDGGDVRLEGAADDGMTNPCAKQLSLCCRLKKTSDDGSWSNSKTAIVYLSRRVKIMVVPSDPSLTVLMRSRHYQQATNRALSSVTLQQSQERA